MTFGKKEHVPWEKTSRLWFFIVVPSNVFISHNKFLNTIWKAYFCALKKTEFYVVVLSIYGSSSLVAPFMRHIADKKGPIRRS